jgi:DNA invertase Pin-like site-specific DNA recombinase
MLYGYARVGTTDQNLDFQMTALKAAGCGVIRSEKVSGTSTTGRHELATLLEFIRKGDVLAVTRIDRLARSIADLQEIIKTLKAKGASLRTTEGTTFDTGSAMSKAFLDMLGVFAEFETNLGASGRWKASPKAAGVYKGRKPTIEREAIEALRAQGLGAKRLGIGRASVYRVLEG